MTDGRSMDDSCRRVINLSSQPRSIVNERYACRAASSEASNTPSSQRYHVGILDTAICEENGQPDLKESFACPALKALNSSDAPGCVDWGDAIAHDKAECERRSIETM